MNARSAQRQAALLLLAALAAGGLVVLGAVAADVFLFLKPPQAPPLPHAPLTPPADVATYTIAARYDPTTFRLTGTLTVTYRNVTSAPIPDVVLHLYLNAFQSEGTRWMQEAGPQHRGFSYDAQHPGWMRLEAARLADGTPLAFAPVDADATLVRADLPQPVAPGERFTLITDFVAQMPRVFARTGWAQDGAFLMAGQWFPKPGVWQATGWNAHPFAANNEFFADVGTYDVQLTLPQGWRVVSTGREAAPPQRNADGSLTHTLYAAHVIDFAWAASPNLRVVERIYRPADSPAPLTLRYAYDKSRLGLVKRLMPAVEGALAVYERDFGLYGGGLYPTLTVLVVPADAGGAGGMEYPTLFTVGALGGSEPPCVNLSAVEAVHELAHQWWQSVVATNEPEEPWLDEGFTDYSTVHALADLGLEVFDCGGWRFSYAAMRRMEYQLQPETPMAGAAWTFDFASYNIAAYSKPATALFTVEQLVGADAMRRFTQTYFTRYAFAHPTAQDVRAVMAETLGEELSTAFFEHLVERGDWLEVDVRRMERDGIELVRAGELCFPLDVELRRGGQRERLDWPCEQKALRLSQPARPWQEVIISPDKTLYLDLNLANNHARLRADVSMVAGIAVRLTYLLQSLNFWGGAAW